MPPWNRLRNASDALADDDWESYERDGIRPDDDWSSLILIRVFPDNTVSRGYTRPEDLPPHIGYIFVTDTGKPSPIYPKLPGGRKIGNETPRKTAIRETQEEPGLLLPSSAFRYCNSARLLRPAPHWSCLYLAHAEESEVPWMNSNHPGNEGEIPAFYLNDEFDALRRAGGFFPPHERRLFEAGFIEPL